MELRDYIEEGEVKVGGRTPLAAYLGLAHANHLTNAKRGQRGLPNFACRKLAELLEVPLDTIIAASELVTEKDEEIRAYWRPFVQTARHAQHLTIAIIAGMTAFMLVAENSYSTFGGFLL